MESTLKLESNRLVFLPYGHGVNMREGSTSWARGQRFGASLVV